MAAPLAADLTVPGLLFSAVTGLLGTLAFLWKHYEAKVASLSAQVDKLELEAKEELKGRLRDQELFAKALEQKQKTSS